jgi:hypothetical protein
MKSVVKEKIFDRVSRFNSSNVDTKKN